MFARKSEPSPKGFCTKARGVRKIVKIKVRNRCIVWFRGLSMGEELAKFVPDYFHQESGNKPPLCPDKVASGQNGIYPHFHKLPERALKENSKLEP